MVIKTKPQRVDACAWYPYSKALHEALIRRSRFEDAVDMATIDGGWLGVPREFCGYPWRGTVLDQRSSGRMMRKHGACRYLPKNSEQARVIADSTSLLHDDQSHIVEASTGFGKTYCALNTAERVGRKTLIVVTKEDLMVSWPQELEKFFGVSKVGIIQQNKCVIKDCDYVVGMVHSLAQRDYSFDKSEFGLVIFDEVHHMAAETFSRVAAMFPAKWRLGYSATAQRIDGKDFIFHGHIGQVRVHAKLVPMSPKVLVVYSNWKLPTVPRRIDGELCRVQLPHEAGKLTHIITAMAQSAVRNRLVVRMAMEAYNKGRWTIVLSELAEDRHLGMLREMCKQVGVPDSEMAYYKGGMSEAAREAAKGKRLVFATYGMTGEATDVPWWDCAILATPRANIKQAAGRILREYPGKPKPVIVDIVDTDSEILHGYFKARLKTYTSAEMSGEVVYL